MQSIVHKNLWYASYIFAVNFVVKLKMDDKIANRCMMPLT